jgi:serine/threonine protein kinase/WD40 repeat protein
MSDGEERSDKRPGEDAIPTASFAGASGVAGGQVGPYKLLRMLGEGGFAEVYLAEQQKPVKRRVALKVIKLGMDSKQVIARFEAERQALALLDHPNIAQVYDAGTTEAGRPYFVMEHVKGVSLTEHCDREKLSIEERLELFLQVCEAVQYAHQKGIIHRDIKPSNVLVSIEGEKGLPKIIDFGVAKAITQPLIERTLFTEQGQMIGTPEYMSPEQAGMTNQDIDTRSDIYSLGVLLYELLTGALPFDRKTLEQAGFAEIQRIIREVDPPRPSTRLSDLGEKATEIAKSRRTEVATLAKRLYRELEWIPLKAMRKERTHRYRSASELADDVQNYLNGVPLIAGPESAVYRVKKFVRRNRALVTGIAAVLVVLAAGIVVSTNFAIGQARARAEADQARSVAEAARQEAQKEKEAALLANEWGRLMRRSLPELLLISRHEFEDRPPGSIHNAVFTSDEKYILDDRPGYQFRSLIELKTGKTVFKTKQYAGSGFRECTQFMPDEGYVCYSSGPSTVDIVELWKDETVVRFDSRKKEDEIWYLRSFVVSPNGKLACGCAINYLTGEREIILWDASSGDELKRFQMEILDKNLLTNPNDSWGFRLSVPCGRVLGFLPDNKRVAYLDLQLSVLDIETGKRKKIAAHHGWLSSYAPKTAAVAILGISNRVEVWDVAKGVKVIELEKPTSGLRCLAISSDGKWIGTTEYGAFWDLWRGDTGKYVRKYESGTINSLAFSSSGVYAVTTNLEEIKVWSVLRERNLEVKSFRTADEQPSNLKLSNWTIGPGVFGHSHQFLATGDGDGYVSIWEVPSFRLLRRWQGHAEAIASITFCPDDRFLATSSKDGTVKVWETVSGNLFQTITCKPGEQLSCAAFSPDGKRLAVGTRTMDLNDIFKLDESGVWTLNKSQEWELDTSGRWKRDESGKWYDTLGLIQRDSSGKWRKVLKAGDFEVRIFDVETGDMLFMTAQGRSEILSLKYSPNGKRLAVGRGRYGNDVVNILDAETGEECFGEIPHVWSIMSFSPDCRYVVLAGKSVLLWDIEEKREVWHIENKSAHQIVFHPDGRRFVLMSGGNSSLHATSDGREIIPLQGGLPPATFSPDGRQLIYRRNDGNMLILHTDAWSLPDEKGALEAGLRDVRQELHLTQ